MSKPAKLAKIFGFSAAVVVFVGGIHFEIAAGRDLRPILPTDASDRTSLSIANYNVERGGKSDRAAFAPEPIDTTTVIINNSTLPLTTIAIRVLPNGSVSGNAKVRPPVLRNGNVPEKKKRLVACEGVVSSLTEIAKQLEPGRCVT